MSSTTNGVLPASATDERKIHETLIVGSGPAGFTAGLYAARANLNPILFTGQEYGGQVSLTFEIENYPGFPEALGGPELVERMKAQAERFGLQVEFDFVTAIDADAHPYTLRTETGRTYRTRSIIAATGARPRFLGIPGEKEMTGKGVSYCATCDGFFFRDKDVVVVGGGDSALEEGLFLTKFASRVRIIHRRDELRASQILQKRARTHDKIEFVLNTVVTRIHADADASVAGIDVQDTQNGATGSLDTDGVFIFVGHIPNNELYRRDFHLDEEGYLVTDKHMRTNVPGVFAAGEIQDKVFKQVATSVGQGCAAAMQAEKFLAELEETGWPGKGADPRAFPAEAQAFLAA